MLADAPGSSYTVPEADSNITTIRRQCKATVIDNSWKMIFAKDQSEFDSLLKTMQDTAKGLGYDDVLAVGTQNASDWTKAREESAANYPEGKNVEDNSEETAE